MSNWLETPDTASQMEAAEIIDRLRGQGWGPMLDAMEDDSIYTKGKAGKRVRLKVTNLAERLGLRQRDWPTLRRRMKELEQATRELMGE